MLTKLVTLDAGSEKVMLIKLQRILTAGLEAARSMKFQVDFMRGEPHYIFKANHK